MLTIDLHSVTSPAANTARMAEAVARVALIDGDERFRADLGRSLAEQGYDVLPFGRGDEALAYLSGVGGADLVLLDWSAAGRKAVELLVAANERGIEAPVICLAEASGQADEEVALAHGALDYVEKSRSLPILLKRMSIVLDGTKSAAPEPTPTPEPERPSGSHAVGDLVLHVGQSRASWKGRRVDLTLTEFRMVEMLASKPETDFSYREIYDLVHGKDFMAGYGTHGYRANVRAFIKRIRQKFRAADGDFDNIGNYPGFGYRWQLAPGGAGKDD